MNKRQGGIRAHWHDSTLCLLNPLDDKDTPCLDSMHGGTINIHNVSSLLDLLSLLVIEERCAMVVRRAMVAKALA